MECNIGWCSDGRPLAFQHKQRSTATTNHNDVKVFAEEDENLMVQAMNELSVQKREREKVYEEIHGVSTFPEETPEQLTQAFEKLAEELANIPRLKRKALDRAIFLKPSLEQDSSFQLMFLRADRFDAAKAAERLAKYFENKLVLFGEEKLVRKISYDDLDEDDLEVLNTGSFQVLPKKDRAGRKMFFWDPKSFRYKALPNFVRINHLSVLDSFERF